MALLQLAFPAQRASGRLGDGNTVFSYNGGQQLLNAFTVATNPSSINQVSIRQIFTELTKGWGQILTDEQRAGWNVWAFENPATNRLGKLVRRTGVSAFVELGTNAYIINGGFPTGNPPTMARPVPPVITDIFLTNAGALQYTVTVPNSVPMGSRLFFRLTGGLTSPAITPSTGLYRLIKGVNLDSTLDVQIGSSGYTFFGMGSRVFEDTRYGFGATIVNTQGWASALATAVQDPRTDP